MNSSNRNCARIELCCRLNGKLMFITRFNPRHLHSKRRIYYVWNWIYVSTRTLLGYNSKLYISTLYLSRWTSLKFTPNFGCRVKRLAVTWRSNCRNYTCKICRTVRHSPYTYTLTEQSTRLLSSPVSMLRITVKLRSSYLLQVIIRQWMVIENG